VNFSIADSQERLADFFGQLAQVAPELWLVLGMCAVILVPFIRRTDIRLPVIATLISLLLALVFIPNTASTPRTLFHGMLVVDPFSQFFKFMLIVFTALTVGQWWLLRYERGSVYDTPDFLCLLLGASFGMALMASANNLLMIVIAVESASLPSFALAGFRKKGRLGTEAALKYVVFGAAASAIMIYGMSLIYGATGTLSLPGVAEAAVKTGGMSPLLALGVLAMFAGFAFKLSAVPLHFWCPDVFQGAPIGVTTFLSVASKGAAIILTARVVHAFGLARELDPVAGKNLFLGLSVGVAILGAVTATWGNLLAFHQNNFKRLLAYSSIAHAGYMIMGIAAMIHPEGSSSEVATALLFYILVYLFMNMGAFTVVGLIAERTGSEDVRDYAGLMKRSPALAGLLLLFLLSLFGMPGLGGFLGKIYLMKAMGGLGAGGMVLIVVLLLNTLISLYFYMRPVYYMVFVPDTEERPAFPLGAGQAMLLTCALMLVLTGVGVGTGMTAGFAELWNPNKKAPVALEPRGQESGGGGQESVRSKPTALPLTNVSLPEQGAPPSSSPSKVRAAPRPGL